MNGRQLVGDSLVAAAIAVQIVRLQPSSGPFKADAALVLGAAVWDDEPTLVFQVRIGHAIDLHRTGAVAHLVFFRRFSFRFGPGGTRVCTGRRGS